MSDAFYRQKEWNEIYPLYKIFSYLFRSVAKIFNNLIKPQIAIINLIIVSYRDSSSVRVIFRCRHKGGKNNADKFTW